MSKEKFTNKQLREAVDQGMTMADIARKYNASKTTVSVRIKKLKLKTIQALATHTGIKVINEQMISAQYFRKLKEKTEKLLTSAEDFIYNDSRGLKKDIDGVSTIRTQADKAKQQEIALKAIAEIRAQAKLELEIFQALYDNNSVKVFQEEVLNVINEVDHSIREEITRRLQRRRALRLVLS